MFFLPLSTSALQPTANTRFLTLQAKDGLEIGDVRSIYQDSRGFMWFGGPNGLVRYDGVRFEHFNFEGANPHSLSHTVVWDIAEDHAQRLWVATDSGLNLFDPEHNQFQRFFFPNGQRTLLHDIEVDEHGDLWLATLDGLAKFSTESRQFTRYKNSTSEINGTDNLTRALAFDKSGQLWFGSYGRGLCRFDPASENFAVFSQDRDASENYRNGMNTIAAVFAARDGKLWVGSEAGLFYFDAATQRLLPLYLGQNKTRVLAGTPVTEIEEDEDGNLWLGTPDGLVYVNRKTETQVVLSRKAKTPGSLANNVIRKIYRDSNNDIWVGTFPEGVSLLNRNALAFEVVEHEPNLPGGLNHPSVMAFLENDRGQLWIGTDGGGINAFDLNRAGSYYYKMQPADPLNKKHISGNAITSMVQDKDGTIWAGTWGSGLNHIHPQTGEIQHYLLDFSRPNWLRSNNIWKLYLDRKNKLWIGTIGGSLYQFDRHNEAFHLFMHEPNNPDALSSTIVWDILEDQSGILWIGTQMGLNRYDPASGKFSHYQHNPTSSNSLSNDIVTTLFEDREGMLWIGTRGGGLNRLDPRTDTLTRYGSQEGLTAKIISSIEEDDAGNLWLSSKTGLFRYNKKSASFRDFSHENGLINSQFNYNASIRLKNGDLLFGSTNGYTRFNPRNLQTRAEFPPLVLRDLKILTKSIVPGEDNPILQKDIDHSDRLTLSHHDSMLTIDYAALDFRNSGRIQYAYMLSPFDKSWNYVGQQTAATYTNLDPGNYIFALRSTNSEGQWGEAGKAIEVRVLAAPWRTAWAYSLYGLILLSAVVAYIRTQKNRLEKERELNRKLQQLDKTKDEFLANTSHELRTPIHGIIGLTESLLDRCGATLTPHDINDLQLIVKSGRRLGNLVNDILDFAKLKNGEIRLHKTALNLKSAVDDIVEVLAPLARGKDISLQNQIAEHIPPVYADENRVQQVLFNLIGNAIKFTHQGSIRISAHEQEASLQVQIADSGIGIEKDKLTKVFDSFEQGDGSTSREYGGTGLGLSISKQLIELNGGHISVDSTPGLGSIFSFTLPLAAPGIAKAETKNPHHASALTRRADFSAPPEPNTRSTVRGDDSDNARHHILIVDDEPVNRQVLLNQLSYEQYQVSEASSGEEALRLIGSKKQRFDLVLLDLMMPKMSGFEVAEAIRREHNTNDLPIIFLTAKNQTTDMVAGLGKGANDYLVKPIAKEELLARVQTQLRIVGINRYLEDIVQQRTRELRAEHEKLKQTQSQLVQAENIATLSTLVAGMAHELNNPTNFIVFGSHNLKLALQELTASLRELEKEPANAASVKRLRALINEIDDTLASILVGSDRVKNIVLDLQTFSQEEASSWQHLSLRDSLINCSNLIKAKYEKYLTIDCSVDEALSLYCDPQKMNQAFFCVLTNACQAVVDQSMASRKRLGAHPGKSEKGRVTISATQSAEQTCVTFADTGCGMDSETQKNMFNPFFTTREVGAGAGLGLSMTHSIIEQHGGQIHVESQPGAGTSLTFILPLRTPTEVPVIN